ncbi:MAG: tyrosine-type recombinase/integrase, partial [Anaerolineales bacterium]|nr:tyrosine-type recombinase/integrase [Anaerolineales bacterium]
PRTVDWYERQCRAWVDWLASTGNGDAWTTPAALELHLSDLRARGLSDNSIAARHRAVRAFTNWMQRRGYIRPEHNPATQAERPKIGVRRPRVADRGHVDQLIRAIPVADWTGYRDRALLQVLVSSGLRVSEACNLRLSDVDMVERLLWIREGKGNQERVCPFDDQLATLLTAYLFSRPSGSEYLFVAADGHRHPTAQRMSDNAVRQMIRRRATAVGLAYVNPHSIRHLFAIECLNRNVALSAVSAMMGHHSPSFTYRVYAKWLPDGLRREYAHRSQHGPDDL